MSKLRVLVIGCGNMGTSHARAYHSMDEFEIAGVVSRGADSRERLAEKLGGLATFGDFDSAFAETTPDCVSINTYPETHYDLCKKSLAGGAHVFIEKPLADTVDQARELVALAAANQRKLLVGYILRVHPTWQRFIEIARTLGKPLVMRMNLNQRSCGKEWATHKALMNSISPIVDCGVHYVDVMCQMTRSKPVRVSAIGARLSEELNAGMYNYGQLQVTFEDGSVGWYEAGWGPMMSEVAYFIKDVVGPEGGVSIVEKKGGEREADSSDVGAHTATNCLQVHSQYRDKNGEFSKPDEFIDTTDEPDHDGLCLREQQLFARAILDDIDLGEHLADAISATRIVLAADESFRTGKTIDL